jgi:bidirectional [NiFe] hydrogenase diaphorase subunit
MMDEATRRVTVTINGNEYPTGEGEVLLSVAIREGIAIPHLCHEDALDPYGACRLCMVEVEKGGRREMTTACTIRAADGLVVVTDTPEVEKHRKMLFELYLAQAPKSDRIKEMAARYGVTRTRFIRKIDPADPLGNRCVLCGLCVRACHELMGAGTINYINRGAYTVVNTPFFAENPVCQGCGACARVCPTDAVRIEDIGGERVMRSWSSTRVPLAQCRECGHYFSPAVLIGRVSARLDPPLSDDLHGICPACRAKGITRKEILAQTGGVSRHV